jgi:hypothetical protein
MKHFILKISVLSFFFMSILSSCGNREKITLEYNLKQNETFKQNMAMNTDLVMKVKDQEVKISLGMAMKIAFDVKESQGNDYTMEVKFKEFKIEAGMPGMGSISIDSNTEDDIATLENMGPMFKAIIDKPFEVVMDKTGKPKSVKGIEKFSEAIYNSFDENIPETTRQQLMSQFSSHFTEETFKSQLEQSSGYFPGKPVGIGDKWTVKMTTKASNFAIGLNLQSTFKSIEDNVVTLDIDGTVLTPEGQEEQDFNGVKGKVSFKGTLKGTMKLNKDTGWVISSDMIMNFNGEMNIMGTKAPIYTVSKITVTGE